MVNVTFSLDTFEYFILILVRVASFLYVAPFFNNRGVPSQTKIGLSVFISLMVYYAVPLSEKSYSTTIGYGVVVLIEVVTGLILGFAANISTYIVNFAGHMIDMDIGLSMATEFNSDMGTEITMTGSFYYYTVMLLLVLTDMYQYVIKAIVQSFTLIPLGGAKFDFDSLMVSMVTFCGDMFIIAFEIMLPVFACIMTLNVILGIMAKVAPQMNMFAVGIQLKILVGFGILFLTIFLLPRIASMIYDETRTLVVSFIQGMY